MQSQKEVKENTFHLTNFRMFKTNIYDEEATIFIFCMKSLKRGQARSLLTQAARHHAVQMTLFRKALRSLEAVEPLVKLVIEHQHILITSSVDLKMMIESLFLSDDEDSDDEDETCDDGKLSFDYQRNDQGKDVSVSGSLMEENIDIKPLWNSATLSRNLNPGTKSAPLSANNSFDPTQRFRQMRQSSVRKLNTYVLPTPKSSVSSKTPNLWHSSPLMFNQYEKTSGTQIFSGPSSSNTQMNKTNPFPPTERRSSPQQDLRPSSSIKKVKRQAFSGPLTSNGWTTKPILYASGPINPLASSASAGFVSSPKISELHQLPRPPPNLSIKKPSKI